MSICELQKIAGERWKKLTPDEKKPYEDKASCQTRVQKPLGYKNSYNFFAKAEFKKTRLENPGATNNLIAIKLSEKWKSMSELEQLPYVRLAE